jgi:hypothetical protein
MEMTLAFLRARRFAFCDPVPGTPEGCWALFLAPIETGMEIEILASTILGAYEKACSQLIGKSVVLTDGKAGTVENVWLDESHGLRVSILGHDGKWPVYTVKFSQS